MRKLQLPGVPFREYACGVEDERQGDRRRCHDKFDAHEVVLSQTLPIFNEHCSFMNVVQYKDLALSMQEGAFLKRLSTQLLQMTKLDANRRAVFLSLQPADHVCLECSGIRHEGGMNHAC